jgi:preprotein translocase subunit YajC
VATSSLDLLQNLKIALITFLLVVFAFVVLDFFVMKWTQFRWSDQSRTANALIVVSWVLEFSLIGGVIALLLGIEEVGGGSLFSGVHFAAAAFLVLNLSFAAASHAWPARLRRLDESTSDTRGAQLGFRLITLLMWAGIGLGGSAIFARIPYSVIVTEVVEVVLFCVFWFIATRSSWKPARRRTARTT